jgi:integrase
VPAEVHAALLRVKGLRKGKGEAGETKPVRPVPDEDVDAALPYLSPQVKAMVQLQRLTGMRSSEVCTMTSGAIDTTGPLWVYKPAHHKTAHHGHDREVYLNKAAQEILQPWLCPNLAELLFQPKEAEAWRHEQQRTNRKTPVQPSQVLRAQRAKRRGRRRPPGDRYDRESYRKAVARACRRAGVSTWHPHRLRHSFATKMRKAHGIETARILLGHASPAMTLVYAEADRQRAMQAVAEVG